MKILVYCKLKAFCRSQIVYKEFSDALSASIFIKTLIIDENSEFIRFELVKDEEETV